MLEVIVFGVVFGSVCFVAFMGIKAAWDLR